MRRGFTLIELLVVVAIISVMVAAAVNNLNSGRGAARMRELSRGVAQMAHYANALALLRQRPVILTYSNLAGENEEPMVRLDVRLSGESMAAAADSSPAEPIYREVNGTDTSAAGVDAAQAEAAENSDSEEDSVAERAGVFFTRQILNPAELAKEDASRVFEGFTIEFENLGEDGAAVDERTANSLRDKAEGILRNRTSAIKAWSSASGNIDTDKVGKEDDEHPTDTKQPEHVIFETNGNCQPHRLVVRSEGEDEKSEGLVINVTRTGKVIIGEVEDK